MGALVTAVVADLLPAAIPIDLFANTPRSRIPLSAQIVLLSLAVGAGLAFFAVQLSKIVNVR